MVSFTVQKLVNLLRSCLFTFLKLKIIVCLWLCGLFVGGAFPLIVMSRGFSLLQLTTLLLMVASHSGSFSCGAQALGALFSVVTGCGLSIFSSWALECGLSSCGTEA